MAESGTYTFGDPDGYAAAFGDARIKFTITGAGDFTAQLTRLKLQHLELYRCRETLPRIGYFSFPSERMVLSFPIGSSSSLLFGGSPLRNGDVVLHSSGERMHQRSNGGCQWGLISLSAEQLAASSKALRGQPVAPPPTNRILHPLRVETSILQGLFRQACRSAESRQKLIERPEIARAQEQEMAHAIVDCLTAGGADHIDKTRQQHAAVMARFEDALIKHIDRKPNMPALRAEMGVAERTLRMCCAEVLGVSPTRYLLLQRLNRARAALRLANPSTVSVARVARDNQFLEFGRFAVTYRSIFGESPSTTLQRDSQA